MIGYTDLFTRLGRCFSWANTLVSSQNSLLLAASTGEADNLLAQYEARRDLVTGFQSQVQSQATTMAGWVGQVVGVAQKTIVDLQGQLNAPNANINTILPLLAAQMVVDSQTIKHNVITTPAITSAGGNAGNGVLVASVLNSAGITDERIDAETIAVKCTMDQWTGTRPGAEVFSIIGQPAQSPNLYGVSGNGTGPTLRVADSISAISNGNFETFTVANTPDNWTIVAGTVGTNILNSATAHSGDAALELAGDGTTTTVELSQVVAGSIKASTVYASGVWVCISGTVASGSTLAITVKGTGATTQTLLSLDPSTLTTSYVFYPIFFATAGTIPPVDYRVDISWTSANSAGASAVILIDDFVVAKPVNFGYVNYAMFRGSTDFVKGDSIAVVTAVTTPAVFQTAFARWFNISLPSASSPSISDSLAT